MSIDDLVTKYANREALYVKAEGRGWQPSAVIAFAEEWDTQFDANQRHRSTGESMEAFIENYEKQRPHLFVVEAKDATDFQMQFDACGPNRTLKAMARLLNEGCGGDRDKYNWICSSWECDPNDPRKPGVPPSSIQAAQAGPTGSPENMTLFLDGHMHARHFPLNFKM